MLQPKNLQGISHDHTFLLVIGLRDALENLEASQGRSPTLGLVWDHTARQETVHWSCQALCQARLHVNGLNTPKHGYSTIAEEKGLQQEVSQ